MMRKGKFGMNLTASDDFSDDIKAGSIIYLEGKRYKVLKKTVTCMSVQRWYWFDYVGEWIGRMLGNSR